MTNKTKVTEQELISLQEQYAIAKNRLQQEKQKYWMIEKEYLFYTKPGTDEPETKKALSDNLKKIAKWIEHWQSIIDEIENMEIE